MMSLARGGGGGGGALGIKTSEQNRKPAETLIGC